MLPDDTRRKIENIVAGVILEGGTGPCTAIRNSLCSSFATSRVVKANFESNTIVKKEQARFIETHCDIHGLWMEHPPGENRYLTRGGEQGFTSIAITGM